MTQRFAFTFGGLQLARHRWAAALLLVAVLAVTAVSLPSITFEADLQRGFAAGTPDEQAYGELLRGRETRSRPVMLLIEDTEPFSAADLDALNIMMLDLALTPGVAQIISPFSLRYPPDHPTAPGGLVLNPADGEAGVQALQAYTADIPGLSAMIADDLATMITTIVPTGGLSLSDVRAMLEEIETLAAPLEADGLRISITGEDAIGFALTDALSNDLIVLNSIGSAAAFLISLVALRSFRWAIISFVPALLASATSLGLFAVFGLPITVMSVVVPILVLVLALADGLHLTSAARAHMATMPWREALIAAIKQVAPANALTSITTGIGFAAISVSSFDQLDELGLSGCVSVLGAYWVVTAGVIVLMPLATLGKRHKPAEDGTKPKAMLTTPLPAFLPRLVLRFPMAVLIGGGLVFGLSAVASSRVDAWFPLYANLPEDSPVGRAHRVIEDKFGGYLPMWFEFSAENPDEAWPTTQAIVVAITQAAPSLTVLSDVTLAAWLGDPTQRPDAEIMAQLPSSLTGDLYDPERGIHRVIALAPEPMHDRITRREHDAMVDSAREAGADQIFGFPPALRNQGLSIVHQLGQSLLIACIVATLMVAVAYRNLLLAPILLLPNLLPLLAATSLLHLLNDGHANPTAVLALTVAFGIAIDDSIHVLNRYMVERASGADIDQALSRTIILTGGVLLTTTLVISIGTASTFFSSFPNVRLFGSMLILIFLSALVADLLVLPALIKKGWWR
ncbi:MAG: MMPL family transporter [Pseudomonadota bacterium]